MSYRLERPELIRLWRVGLPTFAAFLAVSASLLTAQVTATDAADSLAAVLGLDPSNSEQNRASPLPI